MSHRQKWDWTDAIWILAALFFLAIVVFPLVSSFLLRQAGMMSPATTNYLLLVENALTYVMLMFAVLWVFFLGGTFASFLNVVAWRVPRGKSILGSSYCPHCNSKLSFRDNIPFVGWTRNRGRCSTCRQPIAIRYLLVEIVLGLIFLFVVSLEWVSGGVALPIRDPNTISDLNRMIFEPGNDLIPIVGLHLIMICVLFAFGMVELERQQIPKSILAVGIGFGFAIAIIWPSSVLLQWNFPFIDSLHPGSRLEVLISLALGMVAGASMGWLMRRLQAYRDGRQAEGAKDERYVDAGESYNQYAFGLSIVGLFLGWQSVLVVGLLWSMIVLPFRIGQRKQARQENASPDLSLLPATGNGLDRFLLDDQPISLERQPLVVVTGNSFSKDDDAFRSAAVENRVSRLVASPHAWLLVIVLFHLSTWRWLNLLR